ncbi:MAG TPA: 16S rRNA (cytosine(1402)-N(4))-methyltransferase RsmH [Candidatus Saccharimonadales bacterium]|nr:16S rRNA (cytosine(1402)-N(4))-methyltransferase RsmH [Candidatus Saccharimonadales bacterium]
MNKQKHVPVLAQEVLAWLDPKPGDQYLDLTAGYGGHARMVLKRIDDNGQATLVDRDEEAISALKGAFAKDSRVEIMHTDFLSASQQLLDKGKRYDIVFADLGVSSPHLDNMERGFSFAGNGPLDMRMDRSQALTAADIINGYAVDKLAKIFREYGEIRGAHRLAAHLVEHRPYKSTSQLANKIVQLRKRKSRIHPATQIFQALRIEVNDEIGMLNKSLGLWIELLRPMGRIGVISFHSLEDRLVKQAFKDYGGNRYDARLHILNAKVIRGSSEEIVFNPRARSAKLRVAQRK